MKKYSSLIAVSSVSLLLVASCDKQEVTSSDQNESSVEAIDTPSQDQLIADQQARISELEQRERDLLDNITEQEHLADQPVPSISDEAPVKAIEVFEDSESLEVRSAERAQAIIVEEDYDFPVDFEYDPDYRPAIVEDVDYDAYVNYDWYQQDVARERVYVDQEKQNETQIRSILLAIIRAKLAYERHGGVENQRRDKAWYKRQEQLEREWRQARLREKQIAILREKHRNIYAKRALLKAEREKKLILARRQADWKNRESARIRQVEAQRGSVIEHWLREKKLREENARLFKKRQQAAKSINRRLGFEKNKVIQEKLRREEQYRREFQERLAREKANEERERRAKKAVEQAERERLTRVQAEKKRAEEARQKAREEQRRREIADRVRVEKKEQTGRKNRHPRFGNVRDREIEKKAEAERERRAKKAAEQAERERVARERAEKKRVEVARQKVLEERRRKNAEEAERRNKAARERAERKKAAERVESEKVARERAEKKRAEEARQKAREEQRRKESLERAERAKEERERRAKKAAEQAERERVARERAEKKRVEEARQKAREEQRRKESREKAERERAKEERERRAKKAAEQAERERVARERAEKKRAEEARQKAREEQRRKDAEEAAKKKNK